MGRYPKFRRAQREGGPFREHRGPQERMGFVLQLLLGCLGVALITWIATPRINAIWSTATLPPAQIEAREHSVYYAGCNEARAAGAAPIYRGQPGYRPGMDGDGDGIACEPYPGM